MRKIVVSVNTTLDGFMAGPGGELDWHFPLWNEEMASFAYEQLCLMDSILLGRVTYQAMATYWPYELHNTANGHISQHYAKMMNNYQKIVFSKSLQTVEWRNARLVKRDIAEEVRTLKEMPGMDMIVLGSGSIVWRLMQLDLIDEYVLWVHPLALGKGTRLFKGWEDRQALQLQSTKTFSNGVVVLCYRKNREPAAAPRKKRALKSLR